ncbi:MAG: flagellar basal-body rod protein FlgG [Hydrogenophaga sp.]|uniref:flagellar basal-body rod protein FlgG n=1 Tax=Hydrogenophaga sp. TaxID=1904254 RepID=UPI0026129E8E|nr:flagellar basal-body rod protein FlgG [Hydrogenophaga sp.]MDM7942427.1 flagellar basal-body rod protein FlgG [Hydrogenophaga sp.]
MIRSLWIAKTGLDAQQTNLDVISNNLANAATTGYKRVKPVFEDLLYQTLRAAGGPTGGQAQAPSGLQVGTGVRAGAAERMFLQGNLTQTGNPLDLAINGQGFFQVTLPDGQIGYTRDGNFSRDAQGQLVNQAGYVLEPGITIPVDALSITVSETGQVSVQLPGQVAPNQVGELQIARFVNQGGLASIGGNLLVETAASGAPTAGVPGVDGAGTLKQFYVEASNVNVAEELVSLIQAQRAYEVNARAVKASDEMLQRLGQL